MTYGQPPGGNRAQAEQFLQQGLDAYDREEFDQALACYQQAVQADNSFGLAYNSIGMVLIDMERYEEALQAIYYSIQLDPEYSEAYNNLGFALRRLGRDLEATAAYGRFLELDPDVEEGPRIQDWIGQVLQANGLDGVPPFQIPGAAPVEAEEQAPPPEPEPAPQAAAPAARSGLKPLKPPAPPPQTAAPASDDPPKIKKMAAWEAVYAEPTTAAPVSGLGTVGDAPSAPAPAAAESDAAGENVAFQDEELMNVQGTAQAAPVQAVGAAAGASGNGTQLVACVERGMDFFSEGQLEQAHGAFEEALQLDPTFSEAHTGIGKVLVRMERYGEGIERLRYAIQCDPADPAPYYVLGYALRTENQEVEAAKAYERFLALMPEAEDAANMQQWIEHIRSTAGPDAGAVATEEAPVEEAAQGGGEGEGFQVVEEVPAEEMQPQTILEQPQTMVEPAPEGATGEAVAAVAAEVASAVSEVGDDVTSFETVAPEEQTPQDGQYQTALTKFQEGELERSIQDCVKILNENPAHFRSRVLLGRIHLRQKQYDQAVEQLEGALVTSPDYPEALYFLGQAYEKSGHGDKASESYSRYLETAPHGPRAERLREWFTTRTERHEDLTGSQGQCELCLRFFPIEDLTKHDKKNTCRSCLTLIGGAPAVGIGGDPLTTKDDLAQEPPGLPEEFAVGAGAKKKGSAGVLVLLLLVVLAGGGFGAWKILGGGGTAVVTPPDDPGPKDPGPVQPVKPTWDPNTLTIAYGPQKMLAPLAAWSTKPEVKGAEAVPADVSVTYELKKGPAGLTVDPATGAVAWRPPADDFAKLLPGVAVPVEILAKAAQKPEGGQGAPKVLREIPLTLELTLQFGYELKAGKNVGLEPGDRVVCAGADFNADGQPDFVIARGSYGSGEVRFYFVTGENYAPAPLPMRSDGQAGALAGLDASGDGKDDLLVANHFTGRLQSFLQTAGRQMVKGPEIAVGAGPVAIGGANLDDDQNVEVGVLLGLGRGFVVTRLVNENRFTTPSTVALAGSGSTGWVFPWLQENQPAGFVAVLPLALQPVAFVPVDDGKAGPPAASALPSDGLVAGAASVRVGPANVGKDGKKAPAPRRLALLVNADVAELHVLAGNGGRFAPASGEPPLKLDALAVGLVSGDWNGDGLDDLAVLLEQGVQFFLRDEKAFVPGPRFRNTGRLEAAAVSGDFNRDGRDDLMALTDERTACLLLSSRSAPVLPVAAKDDPDRHPTKNFLIHAEAGLKGSFDPEPGVAYAATSAVKDGAMGKLTLKLVEGPWSVEDMDKEMMALPQWNWISRGQAKQVGGLESVRMEGTYTKDGKPRHYLVYLITVINQVRHAQVRVDAPEDQWAQVHEAFEKTVLSFRVLKAGE